MVAYKQLLLLRWLGCNKSIKFIEIFFSPCSLFGTGLFFQLIASLSLLLYTHLSPLFFFSLSSFVLIMDTPSTFLDFTNENLVQVIPISSCEYQSFVITSSILNVIDNNQICFERSAKHSSSSLPGQDHC